jgi:heme exporter protein C
LVIALAGVGLLATLALALLHAPVEAEMGVVQKIFYLHVPSAYTMYLAWAVCTVCSIVYLVRRDPRFDMLAKSAAELALLFTALVLISGPLWGRKAWGGYWTWDPRLTSTLLLFLIMIAYALLRSLTRGEVERRFAAALAILGACVAPIIHISVQKWRGQHPTVITGEGGGLAPGMVLPFAVAMIAFTLLFVGLLWRRYQLETNRRRLAEVYEQAAIGGLLDEGPR